MLRCCERYEVKKIITHCPHCLNSLAQDYPQFGGDYEVVHHSVFLSQLIMDGKLEVDPAKAGIVAGKITYHDPCYLVAGGRDDRGAAGLDRCCAGSWRRCRATPGDRLLRGWWWAHVVR